jgi:hypothetical protein
MVFTYDQDQVNAALVCKAPEDAPCRTLPDCDCESYSMPEQDGQGWFHTASNPEFDITDPDSEEEVQHRHSPGRTCNLENWINAESPYECAGRFPNFEVGRVPIDTFWEGDFYSWAPVES